MNTRTRKTIKPCTALRVISPPQVEDTELIEIFESVIFRSLTRSAERVACSGWVSSFKVTMIEREEPEPTSCGEVSGAKPADPKASETWLTLSDVLVSWYSVPPLKSMPTLKPRKM